MVEDDLAVRQVLVEILTEECYTVLDAGNGPDALRLALGQQPDVIVLDPGLPGSSTFDVLRQLKHDQPTHEIPVLVVSGYAFVPAGDTLGQADDRVPKPFELNDLLVHVNQLASARG